MEKIIGDKMKKNNFKMKFEKISRKRMKVLQKRWKDGWKNRFCGRDGRMEGWMSFAEEMEGWMEE